MMVTPEQVAVVVSVTRSGSGCQYPIVWTVSGAAETFAVAAERAAGTDTRKDRRVSIL
jgi:hypothetical protein